MYKYLFTPQKINQLEIRNRIVMLAMHTTYATDDNKATDRDVAFYGARAKGGAGIIFMPAAISQRGQIDRMHGIWNDDFVPGLKRIAEAVHEGGAAYFLQLFHCGRNGNQQTLKGLDPWAPSEVDSPMYHGKTIAMNKEQILQVQDEFAAAAKRAKEAGIDGVEISATVGYIITQFFSTVTNKRTDEYGGSEENRFRFGLEVLRKARAAVGEDYPMGIRLSGAQMMDEGYDLPAMLRFCRIIEEEKLVDFVNVTGGWHESPIPLITYHVPPGGYANFAEAVKRVVSVPVMMSNRINSGEVAEDLLKKGIIDFAGVGRGFLTDPNFVNNIKEGKPYNICQGCNRGCLENVFRQKPITCAFNPEAGLEYIENQHPKKEHDEKILVIGGGPAGMEAAIKASQRGYEVTLATKDDCLGGQANLAGLAPLKADILKFVEYMKFRLEEEGVNILLNTEVDEALVKDLAPNQVVIATGSKPVIPNNANILEGLQTGRIVLAEDILTMDGPELAEFRKGHTLIIGGGPTGLDAAHFIAESAFASPEARAFIDSHVPDHMGTMYIPVDITVLETTKKAGVALGSLRRLVMADLKKLGIKFRTSTALVTVANGFVIAKDTDAPEGVIASAEKIPADKIVLAMGVEPVIPDIVENLTDQGIPCTVLGDADKPKDIMSALQSAYQWSLEI